MKHVRFYVVFLLMISAGLFPLFGIGAAEEAEEEQLVIYAYDSFASEWGPGPHAVEAFTEETGIAVHMVSAGDAGQVLQRAIMEQDDPQADVIIGVDNNMLARAAEAELLIPYKSPLLEYIPQELHFDPEYRLLPYDHGYFSIIYDSEKIDDPPSNLEDLTDERFSDSLILMDPRTSSPGLGFLFWTIAVYGDDYLDYWERLKPSILTISDGWDTGYGLFTQEEAPLVLSYTTSPPYHVEHEETTRFQAALFEEGHYAQIEGLGILQGTELLEEAQWFVDFILSKSFQEVIPQTNWMYPVHREAELPESFAYAPQPEHSLLLDAGEIRENMDQWLDQWAEGMVR